MVARRPGLSLSTSSAMGAPSSGPSTAPSWSRSITAGGRPRRRRAAGKLEQLAAMEVPVRGDEGVSGIGRPSLELAQRGLSALRQRGGDGGNKLDGGRRSVKSLRRGQRREAFERVTMQLAQHLP